MKHLAILPMDMHCQCLQYRPRHDRTDNVEQKTHPECRYAPNKSTLLSGKSISNEQYQVRNKPAIPRHYLRNQSFLLLAFYSYPHTDEEKQYVLTRSPDAENIWDKFSTDNSKTIKSYSNRPPYKRLLDHHSSQRPNDSKHTEQHPQKPKLTWIYAEDIFFNQIRQVPSEKIF